MTYCGANVAFDPKRTLTDPFQPTGACWYDACVESRGQQMRRREFITLMGAAELPRQSQAERQLPQHSCRHE
jgi:hypothetical protein